MTVSCEQLFYGRGARGYDILGASPGAAKFTARVAALCGAVGTPTGDYGGEPFLLSVPENDHVIMLCGRHGVPDSMGRSTLFFHVLVASKAEMANARVNAFSLFLQGAFADKMPSGEIVPLCVDVKPTEEHDQHPESFARVITPCVIRSEKPLFDFVRVAVGDQALTLAWATFTFQALPDFDIQVIPSRVQGLRATNEYDAFGNLVKETNTVVSSENVRPYQPTRPPIAGVEQTKSGFSTMLKFSILFNVVLAAVCAVLLVSRKETTNSPSTRSEQIVITNTIEKVVTKVVVEPISDAVKEKLEKAAVKKLEDAFPKKDVIEDFDKAVNDCDSFFGDVYPSVRINEGKDGLLRANVLLGKLKSYVDFVNKNLLKGNAQ